MNDILKEIIEAIKMINHRDLWDYIAIIAPIALSVVAVSISVYAIIKQTKLDLFEKRYTAINVLSFLVEGTKTMLSEKIQEKDIWRVGMYSYKSTNSLPKSNYTDDDVLSFYYSLIFQIAKLKCLFPTRKVKNINKFSEAFINYISNLYEDKDIKDNKRQLREIIDLMEREKTLEKIDKYLKVW